MGQRNCLHFWDSIGVRHQFEIEGVKAYQCLAATIHGRGDLLKVGHVINLHEPGNNGHLPAIREITRTPSHVWRKSCSDPAKLNQPNCRVENTKQEWSIFSAGRTNIFLISRINHALYKQRILKHFL